MKRKKAIEILNIQLTKLEFEENRNHLWTDETKAYMKDFFGENSDQYAFFGNSFNASWTKHPSIGSSIGDLETQFFRTKQLIENSIQRISTNGLYKPRKPNFLSRISDAWLAFILTVLLPGLVTLGFLIGQNYGNVEMVETK